MAIIRSNYNQYMWSSWREKCNEKETSLITILLPHLVFFILLGVTCFLSVTGCVCTLYMLGDFPHLTLQIPKFFADCEKHPMLCQSLATTFNPSWATGHSLKYNKKTKTFNWKKNIKLCIPLLVSLQMRLE